MNHTCLVHGTLEALVVHLITSLEWVLVLVLLGVHLLPLRALRITPIRLLVRLSLVTIMVVLVLGMLDLILVHLRIVLLVRVLDVLQT